MRLAWVSSEEVCLRQRGLHPCLCRTLSRIDRLFGRYLLSVGSRSEPVRQSSSETFLSNDPHFRPTLHQRVLQNGSTAPCIGHRKQHPTAAASISGDSNSPISRNSYSWVIGIIDNIRNTQQSISSTTRSGTSIVCWTRGTACHQETCHRLDQC